jgi:hypothetical protein
MCGITQRIEALLEFAGQTLRSAVNHKQIDEGIDDMSIRI